MRSEPVNWFALQSAWIALAILMNLYSYLLTLQGEPRLTSTDPLAGMIIFLCYIPLLWLGIRGWRSTYLLSTIAFLALIIASGILKHIAAFFQPNGLHEYSSSFWWAMAISLNIYGVSASTMAMLQLPKTDST